MVIGLQRNVRSESPVNTMAILQSLLHLGLGTGSTSKVSIATNGREVSSASGEIVVRYRGEVATSIISRSTTTSGKAHHVIVTRRVERRRVGRHPTDRKATVMLCRLPVNGFETILELSGGAELPLADNSPNDHATSSRCGDYNEDRYGRVREA
jgi:hypothetical protein